MLNPSDVQSHTAADDEVDCSPFSVFGKVVCSGPSGWKRTAAEESSQLAEVRKLNLLSPGDTREFHNTLRGSEMIATALLLGFTFSYVQSVPNLESHEDTNLFGEHTEVAQDIVNTCMVVSSLLCAFCLVYDVHMLMLTGELPTEQLQTFERAAGAATFISMPVYWLAVLLFGIGIVLLAACTFKAWVGAVTLAVAAIALALGLPILMNVTAIARITTLKYHQRRRQLAARNDE